MLDLEDTTTIHAISVHLHPFATAFQFWDKTADKLIYEASFQTDNTAPGFEKIDYYSSDTGITVYPGHQYELLATYHKTDTGVMHTAMAVMYLYLKE